MTHGVKTLPEHGRSAEFLVAIADAGAAADRAAHLAAEACQWTRRIPGAECEVAELASASMRARLAAEQSCNAKTVSGAWSLARLAWAAEISAEEASARVTTMVAEMFMSDK
jgi:hypothetical protein